MTYTQRILLLLLSFSSLVAAVNFTQCLQDLRNDPNATGGVDSHGHPTSPAQAVGFTYRTCTTRCGSGPGSFDLKYFTQSFSSWLLPWLALISELPFGSGNYVDDFVSVAISVGSPALAAYSLMLTSLNARSVYRRARRVDHRSNIAVARALIPLQQIPLELTKDEHLLAFIPINDQWSREIVDRLDRRRGVWSIAIGATITWATLVFLLTLVDTFASSDGFSAGKFKGLSLDTIWLWLPCLVIGWLWVPTFTSGDLRSAIYHGNQSVMEKAFKGLRPAGETVRKTMSSTKTKFTDKSLKTMRISRQPINVVTEAPEENERVKKQSLQEDTERTGQGTGQETNPLRILVHPQSTVSLQLSPENQQHHNDPSVSADPIANQSAVSVARSAGVYSITENQTDDLLVFKKPNSLNRDEFRLAAAFNYSRIMRYLVLVDGVFRALDKAAHERAHERDEKGRPIPENTPQPARDVLFPPGALTSMFTASIFALILQCGTAVAAAIIAIFTPTVGVGCDSLGYIVYGVVAVVIMFLTIISTILARISETRDERSTAIKALTASISIALRRISLFLAFVNAIEMVLLTYLQFSNFLENCYCIASVTGRGTDSYIITTLDSWASTMTNSRIASTVLSGVGMAVYMIPLWFISASPVEIDDF